MGRCGRKWRILTGTILTAALSSVIALWLCYRYTPAWYTESQIPHEQAEELALLFENITLARFNNAAQQVKPFSFTFDQHQINGELEYRSAGIPDLLPAGVDEPVILFRPGRIVIAATIHQGSISTVMSMHLGAAIGDDGQLHITVEKMAGGSLPLPRKVRNLVLDELTLRNQPPPQTDEGWLDEYNVWSDAIFNGSAIEPRFTIPGVFKKHIRISNIHIGHEQLTVSVEPVAREWNIEVGAEQENAGAVVKQFAN